MGTDLELLTVGRISIDLYCDQVGADWHAAETFSKAVGGSPTNVAIAAARLGHRTAVFTKVGEDPFGEVAIGELQDFGVDTRYVSAEPGTVTPLAFAVLDPPEDPQLLFRRDPPVPDFQLRPDDVDAATVTEVPILWVTASALSQEPSASTAAGMLQTRGRRRHTVLDLDYRPTFWRSREEASARIGAAVEPRDDRGRQPRGMRRRGGHAMTRTRPRRAYGQTESSSRSSSSAATGCCCRATQGERLIAPPQIEVLCGLGPATRSVVRSATGCSAAGRPSARSRSRTRPAGSSPRGSCARRRCPTNTRWSSCSRRCRRLTRALQGSPA